jgi:Protein of unknown function (DUF4231)
MPATRNSSTQESEGPVAQLLIYTEEILELENQLQLAKILRRLFRLSSFGAFIGFFAIYAFNVVEWRDHKVKDLTDWPAIILELAMIGFIVYYNAARIIAKASDDAQQSMKIFDVRRLELDLELAQERKRLHAVSLNLDLSTRQLIYRDSVPNEIDKYRSESKYYRRVHNFLQAIIIIGALAASTLTGLLQSVPVLRWFAVGTSFAVGVSAGFTGYFKFRERSFYLQQTSDSIDQELSAVGLGIGRYKGRAEKEAMTEFTEQVELLKIEQRKRQQQLEQPSGGREGTQ